MDPTLLILDVQEKEVGDVKPPTFAPPKTSTGFPQHRKRTRVSAFKQQKQAQSNRTDISSTSAPSPQTTHSARDGGRTPPLSFEEQEHRRIDQENQQRIDDMSPEEIAEAQQEILKTLDPSLVQMLLKRSKIDDASGPLPLDPPRPEPPAIIVDDTTTASKPRESPKPKKTVSFAQPTPPTEAAAQLNDHLDQDAPPPTPPSDLFPLTSTENIHFPSPPPPSDLDLDPSSPNFLSALHAKYFPSLPADPSKLAWMAPLPTPHSPADRSSPYYPDQPSLAPSQLRFDFRGRLLPPRVARSIPVSKGLHHHGEAPEAAGYTILELARLARSAVAAQRCVAFQTLGRVLYRLGRGEWGGVDGEVAVGVWRLVQDGRALETLNEAAAVEGGHRSSRAYAVEAVWLFEKGGWGKRLRGR